MLCCVAEFVFVCVCRLATAVTVNQKRFCTFNWTWNTCVHLELRTQKNVAGIAEAVSYKCSVRLDSLVGF